MLRSGPAQPGVSRSTHHRIAANCFTWSMAARLSSSSRQFADRGQRRSGFEQRFEARQDFWPANRNRTDQLGAGLVDFVHDRQLHDLARLLDLNRAARVALFVQLGPELVAPSEDQPLRLLDLDNLARVSDPAIGEDQLPR